MSYQDLQDKGFDLTNLIIRQVSEADLPALEWDGEYKKYRRMYANLYQDYLAGKTLLWVVELPHGEIIGQTFILLNGGDKDTADGRHRAYLFALRVKRNYQNLGVGSRLLQFVEKDLRSRGFSIITLNVAKENKSALRLYQRQGYQITGPRSGIWSYLDHEGNIQHVNEPAWRMVKRISEPD